MHYMLILPMALVGLVITLLWVAGKFGIGHFALYYGASSLIARVCGG